MIKVCIPTTPERRKRLLDCINSVQANSGYPHEVVVFENLLGGWVKAVREMLKDLGRDPVVVIGDDAAPQSGWLKILVNAYSQKFPNSDGLVQPDDGGHRGKIASYPMATPQYLLRWLYSGYFHNYADKELRDVSVTRGKYLWVPESKVVHLHFSTNPDLYDQTYALQKKTGRKDRLLYEKRRSASNNFQNLELIDWDEEV